VLDKHSLNCDIVINDIDNPLNFKILMDGSEVVSIKTNKPMYSFSHEFIHSDEHNLSFVLSGKTDKHTSIDINNNIIKSAQVEISNITIDGIDITNVLLGDDNISEYHHSYNRNEDDTEIHNGFDRSMGFNGTLNIRFQTPIHSWVSSKT
jgi:hypothetical protein